MDKQDYIRQCIEKNKIILTKINQPSGFNLGESGKGREVMLTDKDDVADVLSKNIIMADRKQLFDKVKIGTPGRLPFKTFGEQIPVEEREQYYVWNRELWKDKKDIILK